MSDGEAKPESGAQASTAGSDAEASSAGPVAGGDGAAADTVPQTPHGDKSPEEMSVGELVFEVSDRATILVREEIELAKTEVTEKVNRLLRGSVVAIVAGIFILLALMVAMHGVAWVLNDKVFDNFWAGFFVEAGFFLLIAAAGGLYAYRSFKRGAPPTPDMAIEEAKEIASTFNGGEDSVKGGEEESD